MTALKAADVERYVKRPDLASGVFLVYGPDAGLVRETAQELIKSLSGNEPVNLVTLDPGDTDADPSRLAVEARTSSLFGEKQIVRVRGTGRGLVPSLAGLIDDPGGAAIIVEAGNLGPREPLRALVEAGKLGRTLPCYEDSGRTLEKVIRDSFGKAGIAAEPEAIATLRDITGNDREVTRRELEKLELFAAASKQLSRDDVLVLCADNAALATDTILDATGTGHAADLELELGRALASGANSQQLLASALLHFGNLRRWRAEVDRGRSVPDVIEAVRPKVHFSRRTSMEQQLRLWSDEALGAALERLQLAVLESRRQYALQETVVRRALLAVCMLAAER